ncbi:MAG: DegT/DnrJ/EryC1/StrS family aminotransferase [Gemmatimonadota bacterium]|nr:DegT/DnrJ/EryC1/StrS family aminotransferase [Gemmatimonadota bacterium]
MEELAIDGGKKVRTRPFPARAPFGQREEELLLDAVRSQNLFGKSGRYVKEFEASFSDFYGVRYAQSSTGGSAAIHLRGDGPRVPLWTGHHAPGRRRSAGGRGTWHP